MLIDDRQTTVSRNTIQGRVPDRDKVSKSPGVARAFSIVGCAVVVLTIGASLGLATPVFNDSVLINGASFCSTDCKAGGSAPSPTSSLISERSFPWAGEASSTSGVGTLAGATRATRQSGGGFGGFVFARATPFFTLDDLVISKKVGFESLPDVLDVGFSVAVDYVNSTTGFAGANELFIRGGLNNSANSLGAFTTTTATSLTGSRSLMVGTPFLMHLGLDLNSAVSGFVPGTEFASVALAMNPFAVFELPEGYTVHGASGLVVDNQLQTLASVPEPGSALLVSLGILLVAAVRRRRTESKGLH